ncbi:MAG: hypothetical protein AAFO69_17840, partial [Bacteroidota bacterium]
NKAQAVQYLSFELQKHLYIKSVEDDQLRPVFMHFERSFDLKKGRNFLLSFDMSGISESTDIKLIIDSKIFGEKAIDFSINELKIYKS